MRVRRALPARALAAAEVSGGLGATTAAGTAGRTAVLGPAVSSSLPAPGLSSGLTSGVAGCGNRDCGAWAATVAAAAAAGRRVGTVERLRLGRRRRGGGRSLRRRSGRGRGRRHVRCVRTRGDRSLPAGSRGRCARSAPAAAAVAGCRWSDGPTARWAAPSVRSPAWAAAAAPAARRSGRPATGIRPSPRNPPGQSAPKAELAAARSRTGGASSHGPARERRRSSGSGRLAPGCPRRRSAGRAGPVCSAAAFFRPSRSSRPTFFGAASGAARGSRAGPRRVGDGPGWGDGTRRRGGSGSGRRARRRGRAARSGRSGGGRRWRPAGGVADEADRAEYAELAE